MLYIVNCGVKMFVEILHQPYGMYGINIEYVSNFNL